MVGGAPYYNLWNFNANTVLRNTSNVIYTFDYFLPQDFVFGKLLKVTLIQIPDPISLCVW